MANPDLLISFGIWVSGVCMSAIGIEMTITPPTAERRWAKWVYTMIFTVLGLVFIGLSIWQFDRGDREQKRQAKEHFDEQIRNEGNQKYMQGQLDSINKVLSSVASNSSPSQWITALRAALPPRPPAPDTRSALEKMSHPVLRSKVLQFSKQMIEWSAKMNQAQEALSLQRMQEMSGIPKDDKAKLDSTWNAWNMRDAEFYNSYRLEFTRDFLGTAIAYRDELIRRLGPQPVPNARERPLALEGWIAPLSVDPTAIYLEQLARKLPEK